MESAERDRNVSVAQLELAQILAERGMMETRFNWDFITWPDASGSRPEAAGLGVAIIGSFYMMLVVLAEQQQDDDCYYQQCQEQQQQ